ncbi:fimbrial biogenesis chaperone [Diaphorobacter aerolatus]|uniref:Pili assembly chaperone C-terminal domain-containing protein n=1 Tax=Diaphorobacter aerolatus TaxID=1288495 RepID=A0A7H0GHD9_9BURK|nr:hypothetical protein [Diaphorobacter aerolatus]QNP47705.1 hypothetical protein H9K75_16120 [Diaphorobacter aerolatus]
MTPAQAYERLHFRIEPHALPAELAVRVNNPSPYFVTLSSLVLRASGAPPVPVASLRRQQERMIAPWSDAVLILDLLSASRPDLRSLELVYSVVNDHGGESRGERIDVSLGLP